MRGFVMESMEVSLTNEIVKCTIEWRLHTGWFLPGPLSSVTLQLGGSIDQALSLRAAAASFAAVARTPRSPITAPLEPPRQIPYVACIRALRHFLRHQEAQLWGRMFQGILFTRVKGSVSKEWLLAWKNLILEPMRRPSSVSSDETVAGRTTSVDDVTSFRFAADDRSLVSAIIGIHGAAASMPSLIRDAAILTTRRLYGCRVAPVLPPGLVQQPHWSVAFAPSPSPWWNSEVIALQHWVHRMPPNDAERWDHIVCSLLHELDLGASACREWLFNGREWLRTKSMEGPLDLRDGSTQFELVQFLGVSDAAAIIPLLKGLNEGAAESVSDSGYPSSFWCPLDVCPYRLCSGASLTWLRPRSCYLLGLGFVKQVASISAFCPKCRVEFGPWDTEANLQVEVHHTVAFTLEWRREAVARVEGKKAPGLVAAELIGNALRSMSAGSGGASAQIRRVLPARRLEAITSAAGCGIVTHMALAHAAGGSCLGKVACPTDGAQAPVVVVDGTQHQLTKLSAAMIRAMAANASENIPTETAGSSLGSNESDGARHGLQASSWREAVQNAIYDRCYVPKTARGSSTFGPPVQGGILAFEKLLALFSLDEIMLSSYGTQRIPGAFRHRYSPDEVPMFIVAGARADEQRVGWHLSQSLAYHRDGRARSPHASQLLGGVFVDFFSEREDFQRVSMEGGLKRQGWETLQEWWTAFRSLLEGRRKEECGKKLPAIPLGLSSRGQYESFFTRMLDLSISSMMAHQPKDATRETDGGQLRKLCPCGLRMTLAGMQVRDHESVVHVVDLLFGGTNHGLNAVLYDNNCKSGMAGHLAMRLPHMLPAMGGFSRMGAAVQLDQVHRWFPKKDPEGWQWLDSSLWASLEDPYDVDLIAQSLQYHFLYPHALTRRSELCLAIDALHSNKTNHPTLECGPWYKSMFRGLSKYDSQSVEQLWAEQAPTNGYLSTVAPGKKMVLQSLLDHAR